MSTKSFFTMPASSRVKLTAQYILVLWSRSAIWLLVATSVYFSTRMGAAAQPSRRKPDHHRKMEAEKNAREARRRVEELEKEKEEQADKAAKQKESAQKNAREARRHMEELEKEKKEQADKAAKQKESAQKNAREARRHMEELEKEKKEQADKAAKEKEAAQKRFTKLQEEAKAKEKEMMEAQKTMEEQWRKGIRPVEWPSREQYDMVKQRLYQDGKFHLAIAGKSGTGKSSLVNAFRGKRDKDKGAAKTDIIESTTTVTPYPDPNPANPFIWFDIPGSGTVNCPDWSYFNDQGLYIFDAIIVLLGDRFTEGDLAILKNCRRYCIPTYIVRSKSDTHISDLVDKKTDPDAPGDPIGIYEDARKEYLRKTRETVQDNLRNVDPPPLSQKVYAVSKKTLTCLVREEYLGDLNILDEHELLRDLLQDAYSRRSEKSWRVMQDLIKNAGVDIFRYLTRPSGRT
ncbi:interferon-inducible GTPase-domain-containing protein [Armillaria novae-zelandiae]|uniref:Interferon-inducible GTPase-domain-containing protein n=1 Tax=Armillaria novae-zelandiae TaxID=153914 RepID=A0AA39P1A2_9AGAR|nr:interferon-inducible GTPase-domain-containing protein [Armillaria novae-zelandiae]